VRLPEDLDWNYTVLAVRGNLHGRCELCERTMLEKQDRVRKAKQGRGNKVWCACETPAQGT